MRPRAPILAAAGVAAALLAGAGVAYSSSHSSSEQSFLNDFAKHLGVSPSAVRSAWLATIKDQLDQAVKDGKLTQAQANAILSHLTRHQPFEVPVPFGGFPPGMMWHDGDHGPPPWAGPKPGSPPFVHPPGDGPLSAAASYLGTPVPDLISQLRSGKTLAQIATAKGKSVAGLEAAMLKAQKAQLDDAVKHGLLTTSQAAKIESHLEQMIHDLVTHGFHPFDLDGEVPHVWHSSKHSGATSTTPWA